MRKVFLLSLVISVCALPLIGQDSAPKAEIFGGYQYARFSVDGTAFNMNGWDGSVTGNFNKWLGVTADFSGNYWKQSASASGMSASANIHAYTYTFGPVVSLNHEGKFNPFVHVLFGGVRVSAAGSASGGGSAFSMSGSDSGFALLAGGGADVKLTRNIAVRLIQADWAHYSISGVSGNSNARISTGLVFRF